MRRLIASIALLAGTMPLALAQSVSVDHLTQSEILEKAQALEAKAAGADGSAAVKLNDYPNHYTMISLRHKNGGAEVHENYADLFFVVKGKATLLSGGEVQNAKTVSPGEIRGTAVNNGSSTPLKEGDFLHIPAGVPHQLLIADGDTFLYFVVKVKEK
jgi:mannose-6-phosphate isomerase-like protein (cupin superfamily)